MRHVLERPRRGLRARCQPACRTSSSGSRWARSLPSQAARELAEAVEAAELFLHPGEPHLFAGSSLAAYDPEAAALLMERVQVFLASV